MASDGPGKYRERKNRASKPYERPKGIIRRVTDSFTGLFSASWLSGWMGGEEEEESGDPQPGPSQASTLAPPGESFIFAHPVTARRSFRPFYPEEGETESNSQPALGVNEGASTSGVRTPPPGGISTSSRSVQLNVEPSSSSLSGRRLPIISSTPATMFTSRSKGQMEPRALPLLTTSTPTCDDGSEMSESSADTGVDASVIPRPDERDYQREILQLDEESLQTLRDSLTKPVPSTPMAQPATTLPSLEETRKRPRDLEPDHSSIRAEGSVSSKSLFSETGSISHGHPQPSALASKRPRFNVSIYGSPVLSDRSVLSDSTFKASPFYPGKTMYGGASAYRSRRLPVRSSHQPPRAQVKAKAVPQSSDDGGLSQAARRILESLEQMSTPISDAKRIPTPTPGHRGSFLDSSYTAAFHKHRPPTRPSAPPSSKLLTPSKITLQENLSGSLHPSTSFLLDGSVYKRSTGTITRKEEACQTVSEFKSTEQKDEKKTKDASSENSAISLFSKAAAESTTKFLPSSQLPVSMVSSTPPQEVFKFGLSTSTSASMTFEFTPKPISTTLSSEISPSSKRVGKMKTKLVDSGRSSIRHEEEVVTEPTLTPVPLTLSSLPKISLPVSSAGQKLLTNFSSLSEGFTFSTPEIVDVHSTSETLDNTPNFTFRNPTFIGEGDTPIPKAAMLSQPQMMFNSSSSSLLVPKLKTISKKDVTSEKLKGGSILDILKPKGKLPEKSTLTLSPSNGEKTVVTSKEFSLTNSDSTKSVLEQSVNSVVKKTDSVQGVQGFGSTFKKSSDEWECSVCMLRNQSASAKCVACEAQKPGQKASASSKDAVGAAKSSASWGGSGSGWGDTFKKSASEWECDTCMVRNTDAVSECVACVTPRPGSKSELKGVPDMTVDTKEKTNTLGFGSAFAKQSGEWECDTCLVRNKSDATKCISCETPKPGAANVSEAITGNFKFGVNNSTNDASSVGSTFKFGLSNSQTEEKVASSGFNFGFSAKTIQEKGSQGNSGFKFGVPAEKPNAFTVHSFGSSTESNQPKDKVASSSVGFSFGVQKTDTKDKDKTEATTESLIFGDKTSGGVESVTSTTPAFQFGSGTKTQVAFSFDSGTQNKAKEEQKMTMSATETKTSLSEEVKSFKTNELHFDAEAGNTEESANKPSFSFNSITTSNKDDATNNTAVASPFGVLTNRNPPSVVATTATPAATSATALPAPFGASSGANTTSSSSAFAFGDKASNPNAFLSFPFSSPQPPASKEENKPALAFSFGSKIDSSESGEPAKKLSFAAPSFTPTINNGVSAPSSLFTFGSKENKLGSGTGFGTPPTSTPAFGAPAPSSNATPAFQFGNSNPPAQAAIASSAFGSPAPAFGSSVNSSNSGFAFGQSTEKKSSTGFDFGQAASNTGPSSFNFSATVPQSAAPGLFQFGQGPAGNSSPAGIFQFGTRNSEVQAPATTFGNNENPYPPVPPSGRVMKKAIRRAKK